MRVRACATKRACEQSARDLISHDPGRLAATSRAFDWLASPTLCTTTCVSRCAPTQERQGVAAWQGSTHTTCHRKPQILVIRIVRIVPMGTIFTWQCERHSARKPLSGERITSTRRAWWQGSTHTSPSRQVILNATRLNPSLLRYRENATGGDLFKVRLCFSYYCLPKLCKRNSSLFSLFKKSPPMEKLA